MTGGGSSQRSSVPPEDRISILSDREFAKRLSHLTSFDSWENTRQPINDAYKTRFYKTYGEIVRKVALTDLDTAKVIEQNILTYIRKAQDSDRVHAYLDQLESCRNLDWTFFVSSHYNQVDSLPPPIKKFVLERLEHRHSCYSCASFVKSETSSEDSAYLKEPFISITTKASKNMVKGGIISFCSYKIMKESIDKLFDHGEREATVYKFLTAMIEQTFTADVGGVFHLNTQPALDLFHRTKYGASLEELTSELGFFARALTGLPLQVKPLAYGTSAYFDGRTINLPTAIPCDTAEDARDFYRVVTAHQAGEQEFGTFDLDLEKIAGLRPKIRRGS